MATYQGRSFPNVPLLQLVNHIRRNNQDVMGTMLAFADEYRHGFRIGGQFHFVSEPVAVQAMLYNPQFTRNLSIVQNVGKYFLGDTMLMMSLGPKWGKRRQMVRKPFSHREALDSYVGIMWPEAELLTHNLLDQSSDEGTVNVNQPLSDLTVRIILQILAGYEPWQVKRELMNTITELIGVGQYYALVRGLAGVIPAEVLISRGRLPRMKRKAEAAMQNMLDNSADTDKPTFIRLLLERVDFEHPEDAVDDAHLSIAAARAELLTALAAGNETTAQLLKFSVLMLANNPELQEKLAQAVSKASPGEIPAEVDHFLSEMLRFYNPAAFAFRMCEEDYTDGDYSFAAGDTVIMSSFVTPRLWMDHGMVFDAERFADEDAVKMWPTGLYVPFGGKIRCAGDLIARMEAAIALVTMLRRVRFSAVAPMPVPQAGLSLQVRDKDCVVGIEAR